MPDESSHVEVTEFSDEGAGSTSPISMVGSENGQPQGVVYTVTTV